MTGTGPGATGRTEVRPYSTRWSDYAIEGLLLATFMVSASAFTILVEHPRGLLSAVITEPLPRRFVVGCAMAITAAVLIYSPWGARTGAPVPPRQRRPDQVIAIGPPFDPVAPLIGAGEKM